jgi:hypothetical protein
MIRRAVIAGLGANAINESDPKRSQLHRDLELGLKVVDRIFLYDRDPNFQRDHEVVGHLPTHGHVEREGFSNLLRLRLTRLGCDPKTIHRHRRKTDRSSAAHGGQNVENMILIK